MAKLSSCDLYKVVTPHSDGGYLHNSVACYSERSAGRLLVVEDVAITGTGSVNVNVFVLTGSVLIMEQWAIIKSVTTLTNMTAVYADLWDGTNSVLLTDNSPGATLSNASVGTLFSKMDASTEPYLVNLANQCRVMEASNKKVGQPFIVTAKSGATTYIRFNYTTTDNPVDFTMDVFFTYLELDGGSIVPV